MQFSDDCRSHALVLMEIANESPKFKEQALALAETWLTLANIHNRSVLTRLSEDHSAAMTQNIDGVCLRLRGRRQVAREEHARMPVRAENLDSAILVMKAAENRSRCDGAEPLNCPMNGSVLAQSSMSPRFIIV